VLRPGVDDDGAGRRRTGQLAGAAADAVLPVDFRIQDGFLFGKADGVRRADFAASAAIPVIDVYDADILQQFGLADLREFLFGKPDRQNRAGGADPAADIAFIIAVTLLVVHFRLQRTG